MDFQIFWKLYCYLGCIFLMYCLIFLVPEINEHPITCIYILGQCPSAFKQKKNVDHIRLITKKTTESFAIKLLCVNLSLGWIKEMALHWPQGFRDCLLWCCQCHLYLCMCIKFFGIRNNDTTIVTNLTLTDSLSWWWLCRCPGEFGVGST